jgi:alkanesulfonate monooxygenase SsuD/methylene tetrahydromethanopterin reductase-like flavin-dependent oxidoreductase (luciferase family)
VQQPHPPIFAACSKPDSAEQVGALGIGALNFAIGNDTYLRQKVAAYRHAVERANPTAYAKTNHFASTPAACVLPDDRKACEYGFRGARFFSESLSRYYFTQERPLGALDVPRDFLAADDLEAAMTMRTDPEAENSMVVGDPARARDAVARFVAAGVDELILVMQMGTVPHDVVMESIRTFADQVMPHFK